jgi:hypothetical protein
MAWNNGPLVLYHGSDDVSATTIINTGIDLSKCKVLADFGQGFYTTTSLVQAKNWANKRCKVVSVAPGKKAVATVLRFDVDRDKLALLEFLAFVIENSNTDFWDFVRNCRQNPPPSQHRRLGNSIYDVVFGPVTLWPQTLIIKDGDQISFHTSVGLQSLSTAKIEAQQTLRHRLFA